jgi:hypothetical protein
MLEVSKFLVLLTIKNIRLGRFGMTVFDKYFFHKILNIFHARQRIVILLIKNSYNFLWKHTCSSPVSTAYCLCCFKNCIYYPFLIEGYHSTVSLDNLLRHKPHSLSSLYLPVIQQRHAPDTEIIWPNNIIVPNPLPLLPEGKGFFWHIHPHTSKKGIL